MKLAECNGISSNTTDTEPPQGGRTEDAASYVKRGIVPRSRDRAICGAVPTPTTLSGTGDPAGHPYIFRSAFLNKEMQVRQVDIKKGFIELRAASSGVFKPAA